MIDLVYVISKMDAMYSKKIPYQMLGMHLKEGYTYVCMQGKKALNRYFPVRQQLLQVGAIGIGLKQQQTKISPKVQHILEM